MPTTIRVRRETRGGLPGWLNEATGRWLPAIAGADGDPAPDPKPDPAPDPKPDPTPDPDPKPDPDPELGDKGKAALEAERKARREAEKAAKDARKRIEELEAKDLSEAEKLKKEAEKGRELAATATTQLRKANLITALADHGLSGGKAKAAARLLDGVEYDDEHEPTNLDAALTAAKAAYGEEMFSTEPAKPKPGGPTNGGAGSGDDPKPDLTADELAAANEAGMKPERYAAMKGVGNLKDFQELQRREAAAAKQ